MKPYHPNDVRMRGNREKPEVMPMSGKEKSFLPVLLVLAAGWIVACPGPAVSQSVDCNGTLASWRITHPDYAKNCNCSNGSGSMPVCSQPGSAGSSSSKGSSKKDFNQEIKKELISNIIQNVFAPPKNDSQQQELLRKQQEEELARIKHEQEELERQKIFDRNKAELLGAMKGTNSASGLKLKGGGEELLTDLKPVPDSGQAGNTAMKSNDTPQENAPSARTRERARREVRP
jgi:hypothetical protein